MNIEITRGQFEIYEILTHLKILLVGALKDLRKCIGLHIHVEKRLDNGNKVIQKKDFLENHIHILRANMHCVRNTFFGLETLMPKLSTNGVFKVYEKICNMHILYFPNKVAMTALDNVRILIKGFSNATLDFQSLHTNRINFVKIDFNSDQLSVLSKKPSILALYYTFSEHIR